MNNGFCLPKNNIKIIPENVYKKQEDRPGYDKAFC